MRTCDIEGCTNKHLAKGLCYEHYFAAKKTQVKESEKEEPIMAEKLSPLDEVRADAIYNHMKRLNQQKQDREYEASKREITPEAPAPDPKKGNKE